MNLTENNIINKHFSKIYILKSNPIIKYIFNYSKEDLTIFSDDEDIILAELRTICLYFFNTKNINFKKFDSKIIPYTWLSFRLNKNYLLLTFLKENNLKEYNLNNLIFIITNYFVNINLILNNINDINYFENVIIEVFNSNDIKARKSILSNIFN